MTGRRLRRRLLAAFGPMDLRVKQIFEEKVEGQIQPLFGFLRRVRLREGISGRVKRGTES